MWGDERRQLPCCGILFALHTNQPGVLFYLVVRPLDLGRQLRARSRTRFMYRARVV